MCFSAASSSSLILSHPYSCPGGAPELEYVEARNLHQLFARGGLELAISGTADSKFPQPPFVEVTEKTLLGNSATRR